MKHLKTLVAASAMGLCFSAAPYAAEDSTSSSASHSHEGSSSTSGSMSMGSADFQGEHSMSGTIDKIDRETGKVSLKTKDVGTLKLHFPPQSLAGLNEGDKLTVHLGFSQGTGAAQMERGVGTATGTTEGEKSQR